VALEEIRDVSAGDEAGGGEVADAGGGEARDKLVFRQSFWFMLKSAGVSDACCCITLLRVSSFSAVNNLDAIKENSSIALILTPCTGVKGSIT